MNGEIISSQVHSPQEEYDPLFDESLSTLLWYPAINSQIDSVPLSFPTSSSSTFHPEDLSMALGIVVPDSVTVDFVAPNLPDLVVPDSMVADLVQTKPIFRRIRATKKVKKKMVASSTLSPPMFHELAAKDFVVAGSTVSGKMTLKKITATWCLSIPWEVLSELL